MAEHGLVLHLHDLRIVLLLPEPCLLFFDQTLQPCNLIAGLFELDLVCPAVRYLLIKLLLQVSLTVIVLLPKLLYVFNHFEHLTFVFFICGAFML